jgi:hypothetical protein
MQDEVDQGRLEDRLALLEARVQRLEDTLAIYRSMASYGPAVDSDSRKFASSIWVEEGDYDVDVGLYEGRRGIEEMLGSPPHQSFLSHGCSHQVSMPHLTIDGDTATAICYMSLIEREGDVFKIVRQTANRWDWQRRDDGWKVVRRTNRLLDGSQEPRDLLRSGIE